MTKKLIIINGPPGVGKTTVCRELHRRLAPSVWLDGDWCWMMNPFVVTEENCRMVEDNITHLLRNFLSNSSFEYVLFNWVMHYEFIFDLILAPLRDIPIELVKISLVCSPEALRERMARDGRTEEQITLSLERLKLYHSLNTAKIDTSSLPAADVVARVLRQIPSGPALPAE
ncbi:broad-specificity NMP kinase [Hydrogenispora ethanolica]|uniref:Broad-specificity NMP kinase n=1 Tax=Hydrogenispora ethanolica TaxID=1082276 RepID=A0A4R1S0R0_HYDET|nr:AAA family ATPase [Hydrogenispora ethanolica]TCL72444.1 broad-specificity NMP kinase [Hydrogenispora ethanolica]